MCCTGTLYFFLGRLYCTGMKLISWILICFATLPAFANERFLYKGDGSLWFYNEHNKKTFKGSFVDQNGNSIPKQIQKINDVLQIPTNFGEDFSLRTLFFLDHLEDKFSKGKKLTITSAYRSPTHNAAIRKKGALAGQTSYHIEGMAVDVIFPGVNGKEVWEYAQTLNYGGVGYYGNNSIHIDSGRPRFWTQVTAIDRNEGPAQNKSIYLSIDQDVYHSNDVIRLFFSSISDYTFGVKDEIVATDSSGTKHPIHLAWKNNPSQDHCIPIDSRSVSRQILWQLPEDFSTRGSMSVHVEFCNPAGKQPTWIDSREFEIQ